ncbi:18332_t:CDS:2 [Dentiscutata erythropus]|uniref:18332_t:CDS:1 n=1 Tax=Dentiscutata erythropus TaxID=1348616 RepID=A0A9N9DLP4_9GLOM|nr:18332_t:CDS:2 [Dentiscutata erythropus]
MKNNRQKQALSYVPPPVMYPEDTSGSRMTRYMGGPTPTSVDTWDNFFEDDSYVAITVNIFLVLNDLLGDNFVFAKQKPSDFACNGRPDVIIE